MSEYQSFDTLPPDGAHLLVRSLTGMWQGDRALVFDANFLGPNNPRLLDTKLGRHLWYPERMDWKLSPVQPHKPTDEELFGDGPTPPQSLEDSKP